MRSTGSRYVEAAYRCGLALIAASLLGACQDKPKAQGAMAPEVQILKIQSADAPVEFDFMGITGSSQQVEVRARVDGYLNERQYVEGELVEQGQPMFLMDDKPFVAKVDSAKAALAQQQADLETATANLNRIRPLAASGAASKRDLDDAQGRVNALQAAVDAAKAEVQSAELNLGYTQITAPVTGVTSYARIQTGAYVSAQDNLLTYVAQVDPIWVDFHVSEDEMLTSRAQQRKGLLEMPKKDVFDLEMTLADGSIYPQKGKIFFADANYSVKTGTFLIRATFPNPGQLLRPGQFVRVKLQGGTRPNAVLVPQKAVQQGAQGFFVWIVDAEGTAQIRHVEVGNWQGDNWFVLSGLNNGDQVVVDGLMRLSKGMKVSIKADQTANSNTGKEG